MIENDGHMIMWFQEFYFFLISLIEKFIDSLRTLSVPNLADNKLRSYSIYALRGCQESLIGPPRYGE